MSLLDVTHAQVAADQAFDRESAVASYCRSFPVTFARATGSTLIDTGGRHYLDFLAGCAALNYGHNDPDMAEELVGYIAAGGIANALDLHTSAKEEFLAALITHILEPRGLDYKVQFTGPTGTNAIEAALKLARKVTGRTDVIAFTNGFHGMTLGSLAATGNCQHRAGASIPLTGVNRAAFDGYFGEAIDTADLLATMLDDPSSGFAPPAAILIETVQGEGGLNTASVQWMQRIAEVARTNGALLIVDDIQAGCGRTGSFFSFESLGIIPDIVTLSKSLSGFGLPMSIVLMRPEHDQWRPAEHNGTFRGNNLAFVTARVALEKFWSDPDFAGDVARRSTVVRGALESLVPLFPGGRVKGRGMFVGLDTGSGIAAGAITQRCFESGLIIETSGPRDEVVKILAPLTTPDNELVEGLSILADACAHVVERMTW